MNSEQWWEYIRDENSDWKSFDSFNTWYVIHFQPRTKLEFGYLNGLKMVFTKDNAAFIPDWYFRLIKKFNHGVNWKPGRGTVYHGGKCIGRAKYIDDAFNMWLRARIKEIEYCRHTLDLILPGLADHAISVASEPPYGVK